MRRTVSAWSAKSPGATHKLFFCQLIPSLPWPDGEPHQPKRKTKKANSAKLNFRKLRKMVAHGKEAIPFVVCSLTFLTYNLTFDVRRRSNMPVETVLDQPWTRKHDLPGSPLITAAPKTQYPTLLE